MVIIEIHKGKEDLMSIHKLRYFISIVDNNFNITNAAEDLHITQPALSQIMKTFEFEMSAELFNRRKGRLVSLTPFGHEVYRKSLKIDRAYHELELLNSNYNSSISGSVSIGIPSFLLSMIYPKTMPDIISNNPTINIEIKEMSTQKVKESLEKGLIDIGILIEPTHLDSDNFKTKTIVIHEYYAYMAHDNPLALKDEVTWLDLGNASLALTGDQFISTKLIHNKFTHHDIEPTVRIRSAAWDYLMSICSRGELVTILPKINKELINTERIVEKKIKDSIEWCSVISTSKKNLQNKTIKYLFDVLSHEV